MRNYKSILIVSTFFMMIAVPVFYFIGGLLFILNKEALYSNSLLLLIYLISVIAVAVTILHFGDTSDIEKRLIAFVTRITTGEYKRDFVRFYNIDRIDICGVAVSVAAGFVLRLAGYDWGKVASWQPDECKLVDPVIWMIRDGLLYSASVYYPNQFVSKFVAVVIYVYSRITDETVSSATMVDAYFIFRIFVVIIGTATVYSAFLIGNHIKKHMGVIFCALVAVFPYFVSLSKQVTGDITTLFFLSVTMVFSLRYMNDKRTLYLIAMAMSAALATMEKWHGGVGLGYIGVILLITCTGVIDFVKKGFQAVFLYFAGILMIAPNMIQIRRTLMQGFFNIAVYDGSKGHPYYVSLRDYILYGFKNIGGILYICAFIVGITVIIRHTDKRYFVLLLGILKIGILCLLNRGFSRWGLELYFSELMVIAVGIHFLLFGEDKHIVRYIGALMCFIVFAELVMGTMLVDVVAVRSDRDTRLVQRAECKARSITPDNMISQYYTGYGAASWCDSEYPGVVKQIGSDLSEYFVETEEGLFRTSDEYEYLCLNISVYDNDGSLSEEFDKYCDKVLEYDSIICDTFGIPFERLDSGFNDLSVIKQRADIIKDVCSGSMTGDDIVIYHIGNLGIKSATD